MTDASIPRGVGRQLREDRPRRRDLSLDDVEPTLLPALSEAGPSVRAPRRSTGRDAARPCGAGRERSRAHLGPRDGVRGRPVRTAGARPRSRSSRPTTALGPGRRLARHVRSRDRGRGTADGSSATCSTPAGKRWFGVRDEHGVIPSLGALTILDDLAYIDNVATFHDARGRGLARAVTRPSWTRSLASGASGGPLRRPRGRRRRGLYERLGFRRRGPRGDPRPRPGLAATARRSVRQSQRPGPENSPPSRERIHVDPFFHTRSSARPPCSASVSDHRGDQVAVAAAHDRAALDPAEGEGVLRSRAFREGPCSSTAIDRPRRADARTAHTARRGSRARGRPAARRTGTTRPSACARPFRESGRSRSSSIQAHGSPAFRGARGRGGRRTSRPLQDPAIVVVREEGSEPCPPRPTAARRPRRPARTCLARAACASTARSSDDPG